MVLQCFVLYQVLKYVYDGSQAHPVESVDYAQLEEHTACECQCKITEADCNPSMHYFGKSGQES